MGRAERRAHKEQIKAGKAAFDRCVLKHLSFEQGTSAGPNSRGYMVSLYAAQIECPGGANGYVSDFNNGKGRARENLAKSVGPMICSGCHLSTMTRLDYLEVQKQEADAEIALLKKRQQRQ